MRKSILLITVSALIALVAMPVFANGEKDRDAADDGITMMFMPGVADPFYYMMEKGIKAKAEEMDVNLIVAEFPKSWGPEAQVPITSARDTTGCGDNFVGGVLETLARQLANRQRSNTFSVLDLESAVIGGIAAGSVALTCLGGVYYEKESGEKRRLMEPFIQAYTRELAESEEATADAPS